MGKLPALILVSFFVCLPITTNAQGPTTLQLGTPIERALGPGQVHEFTVKLEENTYIQVAVEQRGIDVIVKVFSPSKSLGEFDSPTGDEGIENVSFVAVTAGTYRFTVVPLDSTHTTEGHYQIKILELRKATDQELKISKNQEVVKAKGLALLTDIDDLIAQIKSPHTRIRSQMQAAQILWESDEKRAKKYLSDAMLGVKEFLATIDPDDQQYIQQYAAMWQLRQEIAQTLAARDPDAALSFLYSTVPATDLNGNGMEQFSDSELELSIANQMMKNDPNRALQIARRNLKTGYSTHLISTLSQLQRQSPESATELANEIVTKLTNEKLLKNAEALNLAMNLLRFSPAPQKSSQTEAPNLADSRQRLLPDDKYRELFQKVVSEALSYSSSPGAPDSEEKTAAWSILTELQTMGTNLDTLASGTMATVEKKLAEIDINPTLSAPPEVPEAYVATLTNSPTDTALQALEKAPPELKEQLYLQLATREAGNGDITRARQIINDHVPNVYQRRELLVNIEQQGINQAMSKGKVDEALRGIAGLRNPRLRAAQLAQIANQIGPGQKRANAINLLEQARSILNPSLQAQDEDQMRALFEIARAFSRYDSKRPFEIVEPLIDQINELCTAARVLHGFGNEYFEDDELSLQNGSTVGNIASQMSSVLGSLAFTNFERAKAAADRFRLPEVRLKAYLEIAQQTSQAGK